MLTKIVLTLWLIAIVECKVLEECPDKKIAKKNFHFERFSGIWYEVGRFDDVDPKQNLSCVRITYDIFFDGLYIITNSSMVDGKPNIRKGRAELFDKDKRGMLKTLYKTQKIWEESWILDTNYDSYSLIYMCSNGSSTNSIISGSIMSRNTTLSSEDSETLKRFITKHDIGLEWDKYKTVDQERSICNSCASMSGFMLTWIFILIAKFAAGY